MTPIAQTLCFNDAYNSVSKILYIHTYIILLKMNNDKPIISWYSRLGEVFQKLSDSQTADESIYVAIAITRNTYKQALTSCVRGLTDRIQLKV